MPAPKPNPKIEQQRGQVRSKARNQLGILTVLQETFCQGIAKGLNQTLAAMEAGCPPNSASARGSNMMKMPAILARIAEVKRLTDQARTQSVAKVEMAHREGVLLDLVETREAAKAQGNLGARLKANELIGKELGMFVTRVDAVVSSPLDTMDRASLLSLLSLVNGGKVIDGNVVEVPVLGTEDTQDVVSDTDDDGYLDPLS
jgi:hypothetical protein